MNHQLYRIHDRHGRLLYVGISFDLARRLGQHAHAKPWWSQVTRIDVEQHPDRASAAQAEAAAIATEHPLHNVVHRDKTIRRAPMPTAPGPPWPHHLTLGEYVQLRTTTTPHPVGIVIDLDVSGLTLATAGSTRPRRRWSEILEVWRLDGSVTRSVEPTLNSDR